MSSVIVVIVALSAMAAPADAVMHLPPASSFLEYFELFGRTYRIDSPEGKLRRGLFEQRAHEIRRHNEKTGALWRAGFNHLTDRTHDELRSLRGSRASPRHAALVFLQEPQQDAMAALPSDFPENKDWSGLKSIPVIDQGECGSCWAVAATYLLRTHYEIHTQTVKEFAVQDLLNCVPNPDECGGSGGCSGATVEVALAYVKNVSLGSLSLTSDEPYTGSDDMCKRASSLVGEGSLRDSRQHHRVSSGEGVNLAGYQRLPANNPISLLRALLKGPVAVSASASAWFLYNAGVFDGCSGDDAWVVDHAVVMVGFGADSVSGHRYWKVMNSWGPLWGEDGMMRLLRLSPEQEADNCGWNTNPSAGIACKPYPSKQWTCGMCGILLDPVTPRLL